MRDIAPIALFCFNRPDLLKQTLDALCLNVWAKESHVTFFCDGPRNEDETVLTNEVRSLAKNVMGFASVTVIEREVNMGCAASVIDGLTHMFEKHEKLIVFEDDILSSPHALSYLNDCLDFYLEDERVFSISAWTFDSKYMPIPSSYYHDVYALPRFSCWGWATWRDRFENIDWSVSDYETFKSSPKRIKEYENTGCDVFHCLKQHMEGNISSWAICADYSRFKHGLIVVFPVFSYITNIGTCYGTHSNARCSIYECDISLSRRKYKLIPDIIVDEVIFQSFKQSVAPKSNFRLKSNFFSTLYDFLGKYLKR